MDGMRSISQVFFVCSFDRIRASEASGTRERGVQRFLILLHILSEGCLTITVLARDFPILLVDLLRRMYLPGAVGHRVRRWSRTSIGGVRARVGCKAECRGQASREARLVVPDFEALPRDKAS